MPEEDIDNKIMEDTMSEDAKFIKEITKATVNGKTVVVGQYDYRGTTLYAVTVGGQRSAGSLNYTTSIDDAQRHLGAVVMSIAAA